jgi:hypothetical protein
VRGIPPGAPENRSAEMEGSSVNLTWSRPNSSGDLDILFYRVMRMEGVDGWVEMGNTTDLFYIDDDLNPGTKYTYCVIPYNRVEEGEISDQVSIQIPVPSEDDDEVVDDDDDDTKEERSFFSPLIIASLAFISLFIIISLIFLLYTRRKWDYLEE